MCGILGARALGSGTEGDIGAVSLWSGRLVKAQHPTLGWNKAGIDRAMLRGLSACYRTAVLGLNGFFVGLEDCPSSTMDEGRTRSKGIMLSACIVPSLPLQCLSPRQHLISHLRFPSKMLILTSGREDTPRHDVRFRSCQVHPTRNPAPVNAPYC